MSKLKKYQLEYQNKVDMLDFFCLVEKVTGKPREYFLAHPEAELSLWQKLRLQRLLKKRASGIPLAYLLGEKEFYGRTFLVNRHTLIPRPETELMIDVCKNIINEANDINKNLLILDIGTGSGAIIITLAEEIKKENKKIMHIATDISRHALRVAKKNAKRLCNKKNPIEFFASDLLESGKLFERIIKIHPEKIIITANLPYVEKKYLDEEKNNLTRGLAHEPRLALDGGEDGLDAYRKLFVQIKNLAEKIPQTRFDILCEISDHQKELLEKITHNIFPDAKILSHRDIENRWRVVCTSL